MTFNKQFLHPKSQVGQTLVLVAFMMIVLLGAVGFAVDGGQTYYYNTRTEIAAGSGAMAGVVYMPSQPALAQAAAVATAAQNGFPVGANVTVSSAAVAGHPNELSVTVTKTFNTFFMQVLGFKTIKVARTAIAVYQPPLSLGQAGTQMGTTVSQLGSGGSNYYFMRTEGYGANRVEGDAFTPNPAGGVLNGTAVPLSTDVHVISASAGSDTGAGAAGLPARGGYNYTIIVPAGGGYIEVYNAINGPDDGTNANGQGSNGVAGYNNCENHITPSNGNGKLDLCNTHGSSYYLHEEDGINFAAANTFAAMKYSVFSVSNTFVRASDTLVSQVIVKPIDASPQSGGAGGYDGKVTGCGNNCMIQNAYTNVNTGANFNQTYDSTGKPTNMLTYHAWTDITGARNLTTGAGYDPTKEGGTFTQVKAYAGGNAPLPAGTYRLRVDTLAADGLSSGASDAAHKGYDVRVVDVAGLAAGTCAGAGCSINAWSDMAMYTPFSSAGAASFDIQALQIAPDYAGSTVTFDIYDIGDVTNNGNVDVSLVAPGSVNPYTITAPAAIQIWDDGQSRTASGAANACPNTAGVANAYVSTPCVIGGGNAQTATVRVTTAGTPAYNGHWIRFVVPIDPSYAPGVNPANWWWKIRYTISVGVTANDTVTFAAGLKGNPVHLLSS